MGNDQIISRSLEINFSVELHFKILFQETNHRLQNNVHTQLSQFLPKQNNSNLKLLDQIFGSISKIVQNTKFTDTDDTQQSLAEKSRMNSKHNCQNIIKFCKRFTFSC
jgi:GTPase SAR1 family protein